MKRLAVVALAGVLLAACGRDDGGAAVTSVPPSTAPTPTTSSSVPSTTVVDPRPPPAGALEVLVLGDSVMFDAAGGIEAALEATGAVAVEQDAAFGFGFSEGAAVPFATAAPDLLADRNDEQVVVMVGSWDHLAVQRDPEAYAASVADALATLTAGGRRVLLLGEPPSDPAKGEEAVRLALNEVLATQAAAAPGVQYLATDTVIGDADGGYIAAADGEPLRKPDGRHVCPAGAVRFGSAVVDALGGAWILPVPDPAWVDGGWRALPRYDDPPGACAAPAA